MIASSGRLTLDRTEKDEIEEDLSRYEQTLARGKIGEAIIELGAARDVIPPERNDVYYIAQTEKILKKLHAKAMKDSKKGGLDDARRDELRANLEVLFEVLSFKTKPDDSDEFFCVTSRTDASKFFIASRNKDMIGRGDASCLLQICTTPRRGHPPGACSAEARRVQDIPLTIS